MLFFNFVCLFYLMVLINGHTISKNNDYKEEVENILDSINDLDYKWEYTLKHDRLRHNHRRDNKEEATIAPRTDKLTSAVTKSPATAATKGKVPLLLSTLVRQNATTPRKHFWNRFRHKCIGKKDKKQLLHLHKRKVPRSGNYRQYGMENKHRTKEDSNFEDVPVPKIDVERRRNISKTHKRKRDVSRTLTTATSSVVQATSTKNVRSFAMSKPSTLQSTHSTHSKSITNILTSNLNSIKVYEPSTESMSQSLMEMTTQLSSLKKAYGLSTDEDDSNLFNNSLEFLRYTSIPTTQEDFLGTAQIEALLNDIKVKAVEIIAEQNPAITGIITNTVTETTFGTDPILNHLDGNTKYFALSTFISIDMPNSKRTLDSNRTIVISNTEPTHNVAARSIQEDVYTVAHNVEHMLQKELNNVYKKVKKKLSGQLHDEIDQVTSSVKKQPKKMMNKVTKAMSKATNKSGYVTHSMTTPKPKTTKKTTSKHVRRSMKRKKPEKQTTTSTTHSYLPTLPATLDDYMMLTLFEHILAKTHQDNVMKMLTTTESSGPFIKRHHFFNKHKREAKDNKHIAVDEDAHFQEYTDEGDYFYSGIPTATPEPVGSTTVSANASTESTEAEDTSFEGLSNKISFNDYVNGYKHYLKFQKEQGEQNFSNLVRYQAHRHHSVDDIGKFILNKIPQLPSVRYKRYFVDYNAEYDVSTKSDDSWFKKHFYFSNEHNPPKKFHSSERVELKSPISSSEPTLDRSSTEYTKMASESTEINLDELARTFNERKSVSTYDVADDVSATKQNKQVLDTEYPKTHGARRFVQRLFKGKRGKTPVNYNFNEETQIEPNEYNDIDPLRDKRNMNEVEDGNVKYTLTTTKATTHHNVPDKNYKNCGYVDVNLIPRPTAIVKLRENKHKKGRMINFFNKFKFHKRKDSKKTKREDRIPRFNPFKKFREFLIGNPAKLNTKTHPSKEVAHDYDILTSRIDTFKPIKYDRISTIEEMSRQIPNITSEFKDSFDASWDGTPYKFVAAKTSKLTTKMSTERSKFIPKHDHIDASLDVTPYKSHDFTDAKTSSFTKTSLGYSYPIKSFTESRKTTTINTLQETLKSLRRKKPKQYQAKLPVTNDDNDYFQMKLLKTTTTDSNNNYNFESFTYNSPVNVKLPKRPKFDNFNDIYKTPIDNFSLSTVAYRFKPFEMSSTVFFNDTDPSTTPATFQTVRFSPSVSIIPTHRMYIPPYLQNIDGDINNLKIDSKLTRIVKFSLPHLKHAHANASKLVEITAPYDIDITTKKIKPSKREIKVSPSVSATTFGLKNGRKIQKHPPRGAGYKPYPDYFNDLLMWHGDLLNIEKITIPSWEKIIASVEEIPKPTETNVDLQKEIQEINDFLAHYDIQPMKRKLQVKKKNVNNNNFKPSPNVRTVAIQDGTVAKSDVNNNLKPSSIVRTVAIQDDTVAKSDVNNNNFKSSPIIRTVAIQDDTVAKSDVNNNNLKPSPIVRTVAIQDDTIAKSDEVLIKGKVNYFQIAKQPDFVSKVDSPIFMDNWEKMFFKPYVNVKEAQKRGGKFWKGNSDRDTDNPYNTEENSQLFLDTSLLAYDDGPNFLTDPPVNKKLSKNSLKSVDEASSGAVRPNKPITKMYKPPAQYFSTPVPMKKNDFDDFLKENKIDVQSVTRPLDLPQLVLYSKEKVFAKIKSNPTASKFSRKIYTTKAENWPFVKEKMIQFATQKHDLDNLFDPNLYLKDDEDKKKSRSNKGRRYSIQSDDSYNTLETETSNPKKRPKKRLKLFVRKQETTASDVFDSNYMSPPNPASTDVELTIISLDDLDDMTTPTPRKLSERKFTEMWSFLNTSKHVLMNSSSFKTNRTNTRNKLTAKLKTTKNAPYNYEHKDLSTNDELIHKTLLPEVYNYSIDGSTEDKIAELTSTRDPFKEFDGKLLKTHKNHHHPKRIKITSQNYKYDIFYDRNVRDKRNTASPYTTTSVTESNESSNDIENIKVIRIIKAVEAVENFTRPSVVIHIDLPTYYEPYTGPTEMIVTRKPKGLWNDVVLKYLSGIALVELLNKFGIIRIVDGILNFADGVDNKDNASGVFSGAGVVDVGQVINSKKRKNRQRKAPFDNINLTRSEEIESLLPNWREKRRLKILSHLKGKLKRLMHKSPRHANASVTPESSTKVSTTPTLIMADKIKRESTEEWKNDLPSSNSIAIDNNFELTSKSTDVAALLATSLDENSLQSKNGVNFERQPNLEEIYNDPSTTVDILQGTSKTESSNPGAKLGKRDTDSAISQKYTAKDVAAIEVIVDLVKNVEGEDSSHHNHYRNSLTDAIDRSTTSVYNSVTNAIQVHIAVPCSFDMKRSFEQKKVRKVFTANLNKPVDLEYQVHSLEDPIVNLPKNFVNENTTPPRLYLLIETGDQGEYALKPVKGGVDLSKVMVRQVEESTTVFDQVGKIYKTSTVANPNTMRKVTLSKDFVAAINKHLVQLYENLASINKSAPNHHIKVRKTERIGSTNTSDDDTAEVRRHINWKTIERFFGHDRVCNCKCKPNRTMCRACAASDAVISELMFEFDYLAKYMEDHCTEIQTFFWMNPSGGKKLRDSVHKVDQRMRDYFKRVRGKCQGQTCKSLSCALMDKRWIVNDKSTPKKFVGDILISDIQKIADDIEAATKYGITCNDQFISEGQKLLHIMNSCIRAPKTRHKLDVQFSKKKPLIKNVYSLDNVNVNIICKPVDPTESDFQLQMTSSSTPSTSYYFADTLGVIYNNFETPGKKRKVHKSLSNFFSRRQTTKHDKKINPFNYYIVKNNETGEPLNIFQKRQIQNELPLSSGRNETRKRNDSQNRVIRQSNKDEEMGAITAMEAISYTMSTESFISTSPSFTSAVDPHLVDINASDDSSIDTLSHNMDELFKIFYNITDLDEVTNLSTMLYLKKKNNTTTKKPKNTKKTMKMTKPPKTHHTTHKHMFHKTTPHPKSSKSSKIPPSSSKASTTKTNASKVVPQSIPNIYDTDETKLKDESPTPLNGFKINTAVTTTSKVDKKLKETENALDTMLDNDDSTKTTTQIFVVTTESKVDKKFKETEKTLDYVLDNDDTMITTTPKFAVTTVSNVDKKFKETEKILDNGGSTVTITPKSILTSKDSLKTKTTHATAEPVRETSSTTSSVSTTSKITDPSTTSKITDPSSTSKITDPSSTTTTTTTAGSTTETTDTIALTTNATTKSFLKRLKSVSMDFFDKFKITTSSRKLRSHVTESTYADLNEDYDSMKESTWHTSYPTIIILQQYTDNNYDTSNIVNSEVFTITGKDAESKSLLLSIIDFEAKKLNTEWKRYKKENAKTPVSLNRPSTKTLVPVKITDKVATNDNCFDIVKSVQNVKGLKDLGLQLPTPPGMVETTPKKGQGLIRRIVDRFQIKNVNSKPPKSSPKKKPQEQLKSTQPQFYTSQLRKRIFMRLRTRSRSKLRGTTYVKTTEGTNSTPSPAGSTSDDSVHASSPAGDTSSTNRVTNQTSRDRFTDVTVGETQDTKPFIQALCDLKATFKHIEDVQTKISKENFEKFVRNIKCYRYYKIPRYFLIEYRCRSRGVKTSHEIDRLERRERKRRINCDKKLKWDWIRSKRSVNDSQVNGDDDKKELSSNKPNQQETNVIDDVNQDNDARKEGEDNKDDYETLYKDQYGIYRRRKRSSNDIEELEATIKNIPLKPGPHEIYVMIGDSAVIYCSSNNMIEEASDNETAKWKTDRKDMLFYKNVAVRGRRLVINKVEAKNQGVYACRKGDALEKNVKLTVITLPTYEVLFTLLYSSDNSCSYNDLISALPIGRAMSQECCPNIKCCSVTVEEPVCLRDLNGSAQLRLTAILSVPPRELSCSAPCRRDAHASLALLAAKNAPALASVPVLISNRGVNKTLIPLIPKHKKKFIVTHTLRKKDSNRRRRKFRGIIPAPGSVSVAMTCPAGYYLVAHQKICAACPSGAYSRVGDNWCQRCSRGARSLPGEDRCHFIRRRGKRCNWWWYGGAGVGVGAGGAWCAACACAAAAALTLRKRTRRRACQEDVVTSPVSGGVKRAPTPRPLSPSRVILNKFFRGSRSSTKATESQETKFGLWKQKNMPPPLPPIDFDI